MLFAQETIVISPYPDFFISTDVCLVKSLHYSTTPSSVGSWPPSSCLLVQMRRQQTSPVIIFLGVPVLAAVRWGSNQMFHAYLMRIFSFPAKWGAEEPRSLAAAMAWTCCEGCWLQPFSTSAHLEIFCNVMYIVHFGSRDERSSEIVWCAFQSGRNKIHFYNLIGLYLVSAQCI